MGIKILKRKNTGGFTLVEASVVIGIFAILLSAGITIILQVMQASNAVATENELRQNASLAMETLGRDIRKAACVVTSNSGHTLTLYTSYSSGVCNPNSWFVHYDFVNGSGPPTRIELTKTTNGALPDSISSKKVTFSGSTFSSTNVTGPVTINLRVSSTYTGTRADFSGTITQQETVSLRQLNY